MKYLLTLLSLTGLYVSPVIAAEESVTENNHSALTELCNTYAEEDGITTGKKAAYIQECLNNMTDLSESIQEELPLSTEEVTEDPATAPAASVSSTPEKLVQNELVETPDPTAEQLNAAK
ncbi:hypothetical protein SAMN05660964_02800 [Thiothrix caldifontis]|uniref:PsiF repeat-containing protein n=1 Tax=Thiothrix caldifontis TaxID=525918 RepID=A0A1H4F3A9_9GAMM|nr:hypothetical protein [Thiothrix caldifontis]SEA91278.1 hypothetical protein SAMN05660964_02800 [Thiothrix caldifontis]